jgi:hypothetical protein
MIESNTAHSIAPKNGHRIQPNVTDIATSMTTRTPFSRFLERVFIDMNVEAPGRNRSSEPSTYQPRFCRHGLTFVGMSTSCDPPERDGSNGPLVADSCDATDTGIGLANGAAASRR